MRKPVLAIIATAALAFAANTALAQSGTSDNVPAGPGKTLSTDPNPTPAPKHAAKKSKKKHTASARTAPRTTPAAGDAGTTPSRDANPSGPKP